ncbi:hypothetical protein AA310_05175 [Arthrobacter sp. YC-RL1]|nr:hypothetical protein ATC04_13745 [Arthrobacter sp. YC-RL1]KLI90012.1 hypothetical protein AA310_05175 [Arthrobacter sp. YC-RL1]
MTRSAGAKWSERTGLPGDLQQLDRDDAGSTVKIIRGFQPIVRPSVIAPDHVSGNCDDFQGARRQLLRDSEPTDTLTYRYSFIFDSATGHLNAFEEVAVNVDGFVQGGTLNSITVAPL